MPPRVLKERHIKLRVNQKRTDAKVSYNYEAVGLADGGALSGGGPSARG